MAGLGKERIDPRVSRSRGGCCLLFVGCLTSQQHAHVSQGRICSDNFTCRHTEIEAVDPTFYFTQSQYTDTGPTSTSADPKTPGAWQDSHFLRHWYHSTRKKSRRKRDLNPGSSALEADALTTRPTRRSLVGTYCETYSKSPAWLDWGKRGSNPCLPFSRRLLFVACLLLNVSATCEYISGTDLLRQFYVLPH